MQKRKSLNIYENLANIVLFLRFRKSTSCFYHFIFVVLSLVLCIILAFQFFFLPHLSNLYLAFPSALKGPFRRQLTALKFKTLFQRLTSPFSMHFLPHKVSLPSFCHFSNTKYAISLIDYRRAVE